MEASTGGNIMSEYCKNCKHLKNDTVTTNNFLLGVALGTFFWPESKDITKCKNYASTYYNDERSDYDSCSKFEEK